jgi:DNA modification methylase
MDNIQILEGDCIETLKTLPEQSVQTCVTSPPYYGLRNYGNDKQIGLEETPVAYVEKLVQVFREVRRVLKDDGTLWLNLGDSYASKFPCDRRNIIGNGSPDDKMQRKSRLFGDLKEKDLMGIPWLVAFALRADGWYLRQDIIWAKPNPMPESVKDRCTKSHEYIFLLSKSAKYYYDADAIAEPAAYDGRKDEEYKGGDKDVSITAHTRRNKDADGNRIRNKRSVWTVNTKPYKGAHFATFPPDLIEPCILAGSKEGDIVLDPFNGSGTTGEVSIKHRRNYIGCELNPDYIKLTHKRLAKVQPVLMAK